MFLGSIFENHLGALQTHLSMGWHGFVAYVWRKRHDFAVLWVRSCLRGAVLAWQARERPGASSWPGTSLFLTAGLSTGCQKTTEQCEICFLGKELTPGARNTALLPSLLWLGPIMSVWARCCPAVPVPAASSPSCFIWAAGQNHLKFFTGLFELAVGSLPCIWLQWVWCGDQQSVENYWELLGGDGAPLLNTMWDQSPTELSASLLAVCPTSQRTGWGWIHSGHRWLR